MRNISIIIFIVLCQNYLYAQALTIENISANLVHGLHSSLKGKNKTIIQNIYKETGNKPLWIGKKNSKKVSNLIQALNDPLFNYKNKSFDRASISRLFYMIDNAEISTSKKAAVYARLDLILTSSMVRLVRFIVQGDVDWALVHEKMNALAKSDDIHAKWEMSPKPFPNQKPLISAIVNGNIYPYLTSLLPLTKRYKKLIALLEGYRVMDKFPKIPYSKKVLKVGYSSRRIKEIKKRLQISGDYPRNAPINDKFDTALRNAVATYQKRYLLKITGTIDKRVTYYLNQPVKKNIQAIITNLDKTKLYPSHLEGEYIEVNIPDFNLRYYRQGNMISKMGLVVGRIDRPTPIFSDKLEYIVLNPTWTIPDNLIKRDLIHVYRENPMYLKENNIHVFSGKKEITVTQDMLNPYENNNKRVPYRFVQFPGNNNALGRVKFMFPNKYAVYLHDTDNKFLFKRRYKIYSSGCMRVQRPFELLDIVLAHATKHYNHAQIDKILQTNKPTTVRLKSSIPVHIVYFTVYKENGLAYFKNDIYLYDKIIQESSEGHKKRTFSIPRRRLISLKKARQ